MTAVETATKPFYATSEFWKSAIVVGFGLAVYIHPGFHAPIPDQQVGIIAAALASIGYSISRALVKKP